MTEGTRVRQLTRVALAATLLGLVATTTAQPVLGAVGARPATVVCEPGEVHAGPGPKGIDPGRLSAPYPTQRGITVLLPLTGDSDLDAQARVDYRRRADSTWRRGPDLMRVAAASNVGFSWGDRLAGSIVDTRAGASYRVRVTMSDPDGGCLDQTLTVRTPARPRLPDGPTRPATPATLSQVLATAVPGTVIVLQPGEYAGFDVPHDGTRRAPIAITGPRDAVVRGQVGLYGRRNVQLRGITVDGRIRANDSHRVSVIGTRVHGTTDGGIQFALHTSRGYVARNVVTGTTDWIEPAVGANGANSGEGIVFTGPGVVVERNRVSGFRDCVSTLEETEAIDQYSIDIADNRLTHCADDAIEADFCFHDCRITGNRMRNAFVAMSSQPSLGGPTYFIRNAGYNILYTAFKLHRGSIGDVIVNNTVIKRGDGFNVFAADPFSRQFVRNNVFIGGPGGVFGGYDSGPGRVMYLPAAAADGSYDYDAYGTLAPPFSGRYRDRRFSGLAQMREVTTERHAIRVSLADFRCPIDYPDPSFPARAMPDFAPAPGGKLVDSGRIVPGITTGFAGSAPDRGAVEHVPGSVGGCG